MGEIIIENKPESKLREGIKRKITEFEVKQVSRLVAERCLTETEACLIVDIKPVAWFHWKQKDKNRARFDTLFTRMKALKIESALDRIDACGDGIGLKQPDWRAKAFMLGAMDRRRFGNEAQVTVEKLQVIDISSMRRAYDAPPRALNAINSHPDCETMSGQRVIESNAPSAKLGAKVKSNIPPKKA